MITYEEWKKAIEEGKNQIFIVSKEHKMYDGFYCLGSTDYAFDKHGNGYIVIGRVSPKGLQTTPLFYKAEDCFLDRKEAEKQLAWYLKDDFKAIRLTYENKEKAE